MLYMIVRVVPDGHDPLRLQAHVGVLDREHRVRQRDVGVLRTLGGTTCLKLLCLMRPCLFYALFVVSRITILCYVIRHC